MVISASAERSLYTPHNVTMFDYRDDFRGNVTPNPFREEDTHPNPIPARHALVSGIFARGAVPDPAPASPRTDSSG